MKSDVFYEVTIGRSNVLKTFLLGIFFSITSFPRLALEVFIRRRFGTGYFSLAHAATLLIALALWPVVYFKNGLYYGDADIFLHFTTWYLFLAAFAYKSWKHYMEIRLKPGEFDLTKYSKYGGDQHPGFFQLNFFGSAPTPRQVATLLEPVLFLAVGLGLSLLKQPIGHVIILCSILYSLGYFGAFHLGDIYLQKIIDKLILSAELNEVFLTGKYPDGDKGFELFDMPINPEYRRKMADFVMGKDEPLQAS